jgi:hypothetical protein
MKRSILTVTLVAAVAAVAASVAAPGSDATKNASIACSALKAKIGATAFTQAYATFGRCVSSLAPLEQQNLSSAQAACTAEQNDPNFAASHSGKTFEQFYGVGKNGKNAFGKCVSAKAKASSTAEGQARANPSRPTARTQTIATRSASASPRRRMPRRRTSCLPPRRVARSKPTRPSPHAMLVRRSPSSTARAISPMRSASALRQRRVRSRSRSSRPPFRRPRRVRLSCMQT